MSIRIQEEQDRIYVNMILQNNQIYDYNDIPVYDASFDYELTQPIINEASKYYVAVEDISLPVTNIPIWKPEIQPNIPPYNNTNINLTTYSFTMSYGGFESDQTFMVFDSQNPNIIPRAINPFQDFLSTYYEIFTYTGVAENITNCLMAAYANLIGKGAALNADEYPFMTYDPVTGLFSLSGFKDNIDSGLEIYCNYKMFELLLTLPQTYLASDTAATLNGKDVQLYVGTEFDNLWEPNDAPAVGLYYKMTQSYNILASLSPIQSIVVTSRTIPISSEYVPQSPQSNYIYQGLVNKSKILYDLDALDFIGDGKPRPFIKYRPQKYSLINLSSSSKVQHLDLTVYWRDIYGILHLVAINSNQTANIKIVFIRKDSLTSNKY